MKNPQTKERPPMPKISKDKMTVAEEEKDVKSGGAPDIILGHKRSPSAQRRRQSQPALRRSSSRGGVVPEAQRLSRGGSEVRESSVEIMEDEVAVVRKFSSTSEQQKSVDRLSRVTTREKRTCEGEIKKGNDHCHGQRSRSTSPEKRSHSIRRKPMRSVGRARPESSSGGKREEDPPRSSSQQQNSRSKTDIRRSQSINRGGVMMGGAESGKGGTGKPAPGSRSSSSGPTPKAKVLKTTDEGSMSRSRKEIKTKEKTFKEVKVCKSGSSTDVKQDSEVVKETEILQENGVVEESISASEAIIRSLLTVFFWLP